MKTEIREMETQDRQMTFTQRQRSPFVLMLFLMMFCIGGLFIGQFAGYVIGLTFGIDMTQIGGMYNDPANRVPLLLSQFAYSFCLFILAPYVFLSYFDKELLQEKIIGKKQIPLVLIGLTTLILFAYFPFSGYLVSLNKSVTFPESLAGFEQVLQELEGKFEKLTSFIVNFDSFGEFMLGLVVIALIPAIGEEYLFRGVMQTYFGKIFHNKHAAIWITAFVFAAFHFQFYGLLPRMVLGALFGYLFVWSGRLIFAMIAHFINNGVTLLGVYLYRSGQIEMNIESSESFPLFPAMASLILVILLMVLFKKKAELSMD